MKKILISILFFLLAWINISYSANWLSVAPKLESSTDSSISITWDKSDEATWYYVYYSDASWWDYNPFWDIYETNKATITWLKPWTTYYVVVTYLNKNTNDESKLSPEWVFNTKNSSLNKFTLDDVKVINWKNIELTFNTELDLSEDAAKEFKITQNNKEVVWISEAKIDEEDNKKLKLTLDNQLATWEYKITVIYLTNKEWKNIEEWINWELKFIVNENDLINTDVSEELIIENEWLNSWDTTVQWEYYWLAWKSMTWVLSNGESVAGESKKLPQTWPESIILIFISMLLSIFYITKRKRV